MAFSFFGSLTPKGDLVAKKIATCFVGKEGNRLVNIATTDMSS